MTLIVGPEQEAPVDRCLGCSWVLVTDGALSCDRFPDGIPVGLLSGAETCAAVRLPTEARFRFSHAEHYRGGDE